LNPAIVDVADGFSENPESVRTFEIAIVEEDLTRAVFHVGIGIDECRIFVVGVIDETAATNIDSDAAMEEKPVLERGPGAVHVDAVHGDIVNSP
jgi:hypothetical protein